MSEEEEKKMEEKTIIVKQCNVCGCLFICKNDMHPDCYRRKICMCNDCEKRKSEIRDNSYNPCDMRIIKSPEIKSKRSVFFDRFRSVVRES